MSEREFHLPSPSNDDIVRWMRDQRWYGDKSKTVGSAEIESWGEVDADGRRVSLLDVSLRYTDGAFSRYFVPLIVGFDPVDALGDPVVLSWLVAGFAERRTRAGDLGAQISWLVSGESTGWSLGECRLLKGEQSNSSIIVGDQAIVKVFRRIQPGINPDSEIVSALTEQGKFRHVPAYLGGIVVTGNDGEEVELAAVQSFVPNDGDSWRWLPPALENASIEDAFDTLLEAVSLLGQRTGELHASLGELSGEAFRPEPFSQEDIDALSARLNDELAMTIPMLVESGAQTSSQADEIRTKVEARILGADTLLETNRTRVHGDYHLGQVLRADDDFILIDFEGEPSRSMTERREKHSPLKDVAGMLRSLGYAVATASKDADGSRIATLRAWGDRAEDAFIASYRAAAGESNTQLVPQGEVDFRSALALYMIEKALYEVRYELDNRPDWIVIPLGALVSIAQG